MVEKFTDITYQGVYKCSTLYWVYYCNQVPANVILSYDYNSSNQVRYWISKKNGSSVNPYWWYVVLGDLSTDTGNFLQEFKSGVLMSGSGSAILNVSASANTTLFHCDFPLIYKGNGLTDSLYSPYTYYESTENAVTLPDTLTVSDTSATDAAEQIIINNPGLTEEEIAALVNQAVANVTSEQQGIKDAVDDNTQAVNTTNSWLSQLYTMLSKNMQTVISKIDSLTDGSSALELPEDITDSFTVIEGGGGNPDDNNSEGDGKFVWFPVFPGVTKLLKPVLEYFTKPLQKITQALDTLVSYGKKILEFPLKIAEELEKIIEIPDLSEIIEILKALPLSIAEAFGLEIPDLSEIIEILKALPSSIAEAFGLEITFPVPDELSEILKGVISIPGEIVDAIEHVFVLDIDVVGVAADELADTWEMKLPFIPVFKNLFNLSFSDTYDYPVFQVQTPAVLKQFVHKDYIVLFDGKDYATQFRFVRSTLTGIFWVGFAYSLLNRFKVRLHIG